MRKLSVILVAMAAALMVFTGCPKKGKGATTGMDRRIVMGFPQIGEESEWVKANTQSIYAAAKEWNVDLRLSGAMQKQESQIQAFRSFIRQKVDIIAFSPMVSSGWEAVLQEAKAANIPVICFDRAIEQGRDSDLLTCFFGSDFVVEGGRAAEWLASHMNSIGRGSKDPINVVELQGTVGSAPASGRMEGFKKVISNYPNYKIIRSQTGNFTRAEGKQVMEAFMKSDGEIIDAVFAHSDDMAIGAIQAIEEYGCKPGTDIIVVSIDAVKGAFEAMMAGKLNASVECSPMLGPQIMATAVKILMGQEVPKWVVPEGRVFDQSNAKAAFPDRKY